LSCFAFSKSILSRLSDDGKQGAITHVAPEKPKATPSGGQP
jgi:hypothetical protein